MKTFDCKNCQSKLEVVPGLTECPVCLTDVRRQVAQSRQLSSESTVVPTSAPTSAPTSEPDVEFDLDDSDLEDATPQDPSESQSFELFEEPIAFEMLEDTSDTLDELPDTPIEFDIDDDDFEFETTAVPPVFPAGKTVLADSHGLQPAGKPNPTIGDTERTIRDGEPMDRQAPLDPESTLVAPRPTDSPGTIINPAAAQEAAEIYSKGLNTVIPPRTISREENPSQIQDYKVEKRIGSGAFGVVFRALQVPLDRSVAVKVLTDSDDVPEERRLKMRNEFLREAQFTGRLEHPNIVPVHDIGLTVNVEGRANPFYVMKEIRGKSWLETIREVSRRENLKVFKSVLNAIAFAHDRNILHCDLKPDNVMVGEFGEVLVVDWGQAIDLSMPETMRPGGTPAYISPEMAKYWCDLHLEHKPFSEAKEQVGFRSDVYLLGTLLFEIVTKSPPHGGAEEETAYQIIRRAAKNEVIDHQRHINDELMQIALAAMRLGKRDPIETVEGLSNAVKQYENRLSSIELRHRAYEVLESAKTNSDYDEFQRARFGFEESLGKWDGNARSREGLRDARLSCAELALKDQNFDLGIGMLEDPDTPDEKSVRQQLINGKTKRDRRKKLVRYLALGLASSIVVGIGLNAIMINENFESLKLRDMAVAEQKKAEKDTFLAENKLLPLRNEIAEKQQEIKEFPAKLEQAQEEFEVQLNVEQNQLASKLKLEQAKFDEQLVVEQARSKTKLNQAKEQLASQLGEEKSKFASQLGEEKSKFEAETRTLVEQKKKLNQQVSDLNDSSKLLRYKSSLTNVIQKLQAGDYRETRGLLDGFADQSNWEVARLNLLAHREIEAIYPEEPMESFAASADGTRFAMVFGTQIELRDTRRFDQPLLSIPIQGATAVALSSDGKRLAVAKPSDSMLKPGTIWIVNVSDPNSPVQEETLRGQSRTISKLEFSQDSKRFLAVGLPSKLRKSSGTVMEKELMVWDRAWNPVEVKLIGQNGQLPKFSRATFSGDGDSILTTNPTGLARDQLVHVFQRSGDTYRWSDVSKSAGINVATFENSDATRIVGCQRDKQSGSYSLVTWAIKDSPTERSPNFISTSSPRRSSTVRTIAELESKVLSINRYGNQLATSGQDRQITIWDWQTKTKTSYGGHAHDVDFTALLPGDDSSQDSQKSVWISVASGNNPEVLKTDLSAFENEVDTVRMGRIAANDQPSPSTLRFSEVTQKVALGNDLGQASVTINAGQEDSQTIQWEVSAWKNHVLSKDFLFAQSRSDLVYKFNRTTGALDSVLTKIGSAFKNEIIKFEVSDDGLTALVVTNDTKPEFHLWDLRNDSKLRTIDYGAQDVFGTGSVKELLALKLSPDGRYVIGGKVGLFAWSTETGQPKKLTNSSPEMARSPVSSIEFINGSTRFLVSWKDRIDRFDLNNAGASKRFNTREVAYDKNEPNLLDAIEVGGRTLVLARTISKSNRDSGISLLDLDADTTIARFDSARFASFSQSGSADVIVVSKQRSDSPVGSQRSLDKPTSSSVIQKWNASTRQLEPVDIAKEVDGHFDNRFNVVEKAFESNGKLTLQTSIRNRNNSTRRDWNTVSIESDMTVGQLRVIAKPKLDFHATAGDRAITLDNGTIRFWRLSESSVQSDGVLDGFFRDCMLSVDEKTLVVVPHDSKRVFAVDPQTGEELYSVTGTGDSFVATAGLSNDSSRIVLGFNDGNGEIWSVGAYRDAKLQAEFAVGESAVGHVEFSNDSNSVLALVPKTGLAFVLQRFQEQWQKIGLGHIDGQDIVAADISPDGKRVVTGSREGRLTIWNSEVSKVAEFEKETQRNEERELYSLQNKHQSEISFVKFIKDKSGDSKIASADVSSGENRYLIWKSKQAQGQR